MAKKKQKKNKKTTPSTSSKGIMESKLKKELGFWRDKKALLFVAIALIVSFISFHNVMNNSYVNWDDDRNFQENRMITDINADNFWEHTGKIFTSHVIGGYNPLTIWTFALEEMAFGSDEDSWKWWHLDNLLLHLLCVFLVFRIGLLMKLNHWGALLLAVLFGLHPMRVESVAWLTERKDVLFASFYFGAILYYLKGKIKDNTFRYVYMIIPLFILSGLSKIQAVSLPLTFIIIDYYFDEKFSWKSIINNWFYFLGSLLIGVGGALFLQHEGVLSDSTGFNLFQRLFVGSYSYMIYLAKLIYPWEMSPLYPYPSSFESKYYLSAIPFFMIVGATVWAWLKGFKVWVLGLLFFTVNVMFVLQIIGAGQGYLADRFTYVPYFGLFFIAAYYFQKLDFKKTLGIIIGVIIGLYMLFLGYKTYKQVVVWTNSYSLWTHVIQYYPNTKVTWGNRANWLRDNGYKSHALADYTKRLTLGADDPEPFNSRGKLYFQSQRRDTLLLALADYKEAVRLAKKHNRNEILPEYLINQASTFARLNQNQEAIELFNEAEKLDPKNTNIYFNRSITYHIIGDYVAEQKDIITYLTFRPYDGAMISNLGTTKRLLGDPVSAEADFNRALQYNKMVAIYVERARNYIALGKFNEARQDAKLIQQNGLDLPADIRQKLGM